jgi:hypothetical protein
VTPNGGFTGSIVLTAAIISGPSEAQYPPTLSFGSTNPITISSSSVETATLTVSTTASKSAVLVPAKRPGVRWYSPGGVLLACIVFFALPARRGWRRLPGLLALLLALLGGTTACGGGGGQGGGGSVAGTTAGTYTATVTATSGAITETALVTINVQ